MDYIDNKRFTLEVAEYSAKCKPIVAKYTDEEGNLTITKIELIQKFPRINRYIGQCILHIAQRLATRPNFSGYTYKDEMIADGVENCIRYIYNFDPTRANAFAYATQIIYYAFVRRIKSEKKQSTIKQKTMETLGLDEISSTQEHDDRHYTNQYVDNLQTYAYQNKQE